MRDQDEEAISNLYRGLLEPVYWRSFLQCLRQRVNCDVTTMSIKPTGCDLTAYAIWDRRHPLEEAERKAAASEYKALVHLDPLTNALKHPGDIYTLDEVISRGELIQSDYYRRIIKRFNFEYQLSLYISIPDGWACQICVINGSEGSNFGIWEKQYLCTLQPALEGALRIYSQLRCSESMRAAYGSILSNLSIYSQLTGIGAAN
jgi:hypothetical protein